MIESYLIINNLPDVVVFDLIKIAARTPAIIAARIRAVIKMIIGHLHRRIGLAGFLFEIILR
jgi:hypothetical protein